MEYAIALDIGGTKIEGVLFDSNFRQLRKERVYFIKKKSDSVVRMPKKAVLDMICRLILQVNGSRKLKGIGVSIPDIITEDGSIRGPSKIKALGNFPLGSFLKKKFSCTVKVANDAACLALGEQRMGAGKGHKNVIGVIYGTGIGSGLIIDGKIYSGTTGSAGEFGHNVIDPSGQKERSGLAGTVEAFAGGPDLVRNYIKLGGKMSNPDPKKIFVSKEPAAKKAMSEALEHFAIGLASLMNILNPEVIVLGGGQSNMPIYPKLNRLTKKYTFAGLRKNVRIVKNKLGDSAGVYGAAALIFGNNANDR
jgi:fructokinase